MSTQTLFHYTTKSHLKNIIQSGKIENFQEYISYKKKKVIWFSLNPEWEESVTRLYSFAKDYNIDGRKVLGQAGYIPARIEVPVEYVPYTWGQFKRIAWIPKKRSKEFINKVKEYGSDPGQWRISFEPIPSDLWVSVEIFDKKQGVWQIYQDYPKEPVQGIKDLKEFESILDHILKQWDDPMFNQKQEIAFLTSKIKASSNELLYTIDKCLDSVGLA